MAGHHGPKLRVRSATVALILGEPVSVSNVVGRVEVDGVGLLLGDARVAVAEGGAHVFGAHRANRGVVYAARAEQAS